MIFDRWFKPSWPRDLPRLYPRLEDRSLCRFMNEPEYWRIRNFPTIAVLPFYSQHSSPVEAGLGAGLSRLLIRDLMLIREISVRGPEDTPTIELESALAMHDSCAAKTIWVTGTASASGGQFAAELQMLFPGEPRPRALRLQNANFFAVAAQCAAAIAKTAGGSVAPQIIEMWRFGRPASAEQIARLGRLVLQDRTLPQRSLAALAIFQENPALSIAFDCIEDEHVADYRSLLLEAFQNDPYNAQTCFCLFCAIWSGSGPEPHAVQFLRRAIELSPGHGKAHMCAPHAAPPGVNMLPHSDLGYRLLPGNAFAINNYILNLQLSGAPLADIVPLAYEGIDLDPHDPGNYQRLMEMLEESGDFQAALDVALALQKNYEPVMNERTRYCLEQNPKLKTLLRSGRFNPAEALRAKIRWLQEKL